jgi:hypothetical protein
MKIRRGALSEVYAMCLQPFYSKGPQLLLLAGSRAPHAKTTISGIPSCLNYCENFIAYTKVINEFSGLSTVWWDAVWRPTV